MRFKVDHTTIVSHTTYPGDPDPTQVLVVSFLLTPPIAEKLRCREACYTDNGIVRQFDRYPGLMVRIEDVDIHLGDWSGKANLIHKFAISRPKKASETDVSLYVSVRIHFSADDILSAWVRETNKSEFAMSMNAAQGEFDFSAEAAGSEPAETEVEQPVEDPAPATLAPAREVGGTHQAKRRGRVAEMQKAETDEEFDSGCTACNAGIPLSSDPDIHASGARCTRTAGAVQ